MPSTAVPLPPNGGQTTRALNDTGDALGVQPARELHVGSRTIGVVLQVVFARPGELHRRRRHRLGDLDRFGDVIRAAAPSESAAQILRVDQALVGRQSGDHRGGLLRQGLNLRRDPDVAAVGTHLQRWRSAAPWERAKDTALRTPLRLSWRRRRRPPRRRLLCAWTCPAWRPDPPIPAAERASIRWPTCLRPT